MLSCLISIAFVLVYIDVSFVLIYIDMKGIAKVFPCCWILISQFKFPARKPHARQEEVAKIKLIQLYVRSLLPARSLLVRHLAHPLASAKGFDTVARALMEYLKSSYSRWRGRKRFPQHCYLVCFCFSNLLPRFVIFHWFVLCISKATDSIITDM